MNLPIQKSKKITFSTMSRFLRKYSVVIAYYLHKIGIHPNQVVLFRVFVFWWLSVYLFFSELYIANLLWLVTIFLCYFLDLVDGDLARNHNMKTDYGKFLDEELDSVVVTWLVCTFAIKFYILWYPPEYILGGIFALFGIIWSSKMTNMYQARFNINCVSWNELVERSIEKKTRDPTSEFFYQLVTPKNFLLSFFSNFRYYLLFWILSWYIEIAVSLFALAINIRWVVLFISIAWYYSQRDAQQFTVQLFHDMQKLERLE